MGQMHVRKAHGNGSPEVATGNGKTGVLRMMEDRTKTAWQLVAMGDGMICVVPIIVVSYANYFEVMI